MTALFDFRELLSDGLAATPAEFDAMIDELDAESPCIMMLGAAKGTLDDATLIVEAVVNDSSAPATAAEPLKEVITASACAIAALEEARAALAARASCEPAAAVGCVCSAVWGAHSGRAIAAEPRRLCGLSAERRTGCRGL